MRDEFEAQTQAENSLEDNFPESGPSHITETPKNKPVDELILKDELRSPSQMTKESGYFSNPRSTNPSGKLSLLNVSYIYQRYSRVSTRYDRRFLSRRFQPPVGAVRFILNQT